ncbi:LacI family DNA-binding transcriptional regulator [Knoellia remsis]|uniref:LacI family DNA-binding transcriptional regulator n=1 Tax=Knoellia remsis TaxID=407159 RepID=UPI001FE3069F|nr:LacI family DNA-binding transcriptional regulator [Knoellia remsis]
MTLQTVADKVGVSRMTVSNAFSRPDQLSAQLREKILAAADELGYTGPDPSARALARGATGSVGVLLSNSTATAFSDEVASAFFGAIAHTLNESGLALTLLSSEPSGEVVPARDVAMDGVIVYNCDPASGAREQVVRRGLPIVNVDQASEAGTPGVNVADREGARAAARHIVELGHTKVALVTKSGEPPYGIVDPGEADRHRASDGYASIERLAGWTEALEEAGVTPVVYRLPIDAMGGHGAILAEILEAAPDTTAVLAFSDVIAADIVLEAQDSGIDVPGRLSVVGFDDNPLALRLRPQLTTVRQDVSEKGRLAASMLVDAVRSRRAGGDASPAASVTLPTELVIRGSTGPPFEAPGA